MKKYDYKDLYSKYKQQYEKSRARTGFAAEPPQSFDEFKMNFNAVKREIKEQKTHRLSGTQIAQGLAREDVYERSFKQARSIREALGKHGFEAPSLSSIRAGNIPADFWKMVKDERQGAIERGMSQRDASIYISKYIFGSP